MGIKKPGFQKTLDAIKSLDPKEQERLLKNVANLSPHLAEALKANMFGFEDLSRVNPRGVATLLETVPEQIWLLALRGADEELKKYIYDNISQRRAQNLEAAIDDLGPQSQLKVNEARQEIVKIALELKKSGKILIVEENDSDPLV